MLSNALSAEDEEAVQGELQALRNEVVRHLRYSYLPYPAFKLCILQLAPGQEQKVLDRVAELPSVPAARPAGRPCPLLLNAYSYTNVCTQQKRNPNPNHNRARRRRGESVYQLRHSDLEYTAGLLHLEHILYCTA